MLSPLATALVGFTVLVAFSPLLAVLFGPAIIQIIGEFVGNRLRKRSKNKRQAILSNAIADDEDLYVRGVLNKTETEGKISVESDEDWEQVDNLLGNEAEVKEGKKDGDWEGVVGFFHPFCNAGGGGERVLWAAIRATQTRWPKAVCVVYTGDHEVQKEATLERVEYRFNIHLHPPTVTFLYLTTRQSILATTYPHFTLLGQSLGSLLVAWDAFTLLVPDIMIDTMGYAFVLGFSKLLFPSVPTGAYVHYPTISTDMLSSLKTPAQIGGGRGREGEGVMGTGSKGSNEGKGQGWKGAGKKVYWELFAKLYSWIGSSIDVVMTNSTWTQTHIKSLWEPSRTSSAEDIAVIYPPVAVSELERSIEVSAASEARREKILLYIAQFRPEKNHILVITSFSQFCKSNTPASQSAKLVLVGSVRDDSDAKRVYALRLLVNELHIKDRVEFHLDASWDQILDWLRRASVGVNGMWNEHFGIGVVEYQAAGLISVVHDSGGPKIDIVTEVDGKPTGFHATTAEQFKVGFENALSIPKHEIVEWRQRARQSAKRFTEEEFASRWLIQMEKLVKLQIEGPREVGGRETHFVEGFHM